MKQGKALKIEQCATIDDASYINKNSARISKLTMDKKQIVIAWWNCSFNYLPQEEHCIVQEIIAHLINSGCDIIGLCEIGSKKKEEIKTILSIFEKDFQINVFSEKASKRSEFDICLLVRKTRFFINECRALTHTIYNRTIRCGIRYVLKGIPEDIYLFLLHWPSRMHDEGGLKKGQAAVKLNKEIEDVINTKNEAHIIVMGDFNDEPYSDSLYKELHSTRDKYLARKHTKLLYNPFWTTMKSHPKMNQSGTYYYASGFRDKWSTFDQVLLSSSWLNNGWDIKNESELVFVTEEILRLVTGNNSKIDHLPILVRLRNHNDE